MIMTTPNTVKDVEKLDLSNTSGRNEKWGEPSGKQASRRVSHRNII